ncbi:MAG: hypothetical protein VKO39_10105, partial [Cyanobacteriota bacterium]|nr:hypothetical protein [Cyanobacteriota bacterium]
MAASHPTSLLRAILATPLAMWLVLPVAAADLNWKRDGHALGPALAQLPAQANTPIPADITALEQTAKGFYERGEHQKALEVMQKVMAWVDGNLPRLHPYRARSQTWMGL